MVSSIAPIEKKLVTPPVTEVKLGSEDDARMAEFWNSAVICTVLGANLPLRHMKGFFRWIWGRHGIDKISKLQNGVFVVRFRAYSEALKVAMEHGVVFDDKPAITRLCEPNLLNFNKDQFFTSHSICKSFGNGVADQCRKKSATGKKVWVAKTQCRS